MEPKKTTLKTEGSNKNAWMKVALISLIVLGGAVSAGSALGNREGTDNGSNSSANAKAHDGDSQGGSGGGVAVSTGVSVSGETHDSLGNGTAAFEIKDFSFGVENPTTIGSATGGAGAGKAQFNELVITKHVDKASPAFFKNCVSGAHYKDVIITLRTGTGNNTTTFLTYTFETVFITGIDTNGTNGGDIPTEKVTFVYGQLAIKYTAQNATDSGQFGWDQIENKEHNAA